MNIVKRPHWWARFTPGLVAASLLLSACAGSGATTTAQTELPPTPTGESTSQSTPPAADQPIQASPTKAQSPDTPVTSPPQPAPGDEETPQQPYAPQPGDSALQTGEVFLNVQDVLTLESFPPQFVLRLEGSLPTPCHQLRVRIEQPDANNRIQIDVYSVADPATICTQVLQGFEASIPLTDLSAGTYTVIVNDEETAEITVP